MTSAVTHFLAEFGQAFSYLVVWLLAKVRELARDIEDLVPDPDQNA